MEAKAAAKDAEKSDSARIKRFKGNVRLSLDALDVLDVELSLGSKFQKSAGRRYVEARWGAALDACETITVGGSLATSHHSQSAQGTFAFNPKLSCWVSNHEWIELGAQAHVDVQEAQALAKDSAGKLEEARKKATNANDKLQKAQKKAAQSESEPPPDVVEASRIAAVELSRCEEEHAAHEKALEDANATFSASAQRMRIGGTSVSDSQLGDRRSEKDWDDYRQVGRIVHPKGCKSKRARRGG